jgi:ribosomal protein L37AE/L43A
MADVQGEAAGGQGEAQIGELVSCPKCGRSNRVGVRYCGICGASMAGAVSARAQEPSEKRGFFGKLFGRKQ